jgi:Fe2+ transport system protein FeoA
MMQKNVTCPLCGHSYNPGEEAACAACPLHSGCSLVCCPACGYKTVDTQQSWLARMASALLPGSHFMEGGGLPEDQGRRRPRFLRRRGRHRRFREAYHGLNGLGPRFPLTLLDVPVGCHVMIEGFAQDIRPARKSQLQAYGLVPGYWVEVLQHSPVTVIKIEHSEVAMENELARQVLVVDMTSRRHDMEQDLPDTSYG